MNKKTLFVKIFLINLLIAIFSLLPTLIINKGILMMNHDYAALNIPYTVYFQNLIKNGANLLWNNSVDLGGNYLELSTIFWSSGRGIDLLLLLFPIKIVPYVMGLLVAIKFALAGVTSSIYMYRYINNKQNLVLASLLYAFSGYMIVNLPFQFFYNMVILFPLLLHSFELLIENNKKIYFAIIISITAALNVYFFIMEVIFLFLYWMVRYLYDNYRFNKIFIYNSIKRVIVEGIIGVLISSYIFIPSILFLIQNKRANQKLPVKQWFDFSTNELIKIIRAYIFIPQSMNHNVFPNISDWSSNSMYIMVFSIVFVVIYCMYKKDWLSRLIKILFIFSFVKVLNNSFTLLSAATYHRWYFMFMLLFVLATVKILDENKTYNIFKIVIFILSIFFVLGISILIYYYLKNNKNIVFGIKGAFLLFAFSATAPILTYTIYLKVIDKHKRNLLYSILIAIYAIFSINFVVYYHHKTIDDSRIDFREYNNPYGVAVLDYLNSAYELENNIGPYRYTIIDNNSRDDGKGYLYHNIPMMNCLPSIDSFTSSVMPSVDEFYNQIGYPRTIFSLQSQEERKYVLGVKYIVSMTELNDPNYKIIKKNNKYFTLYEIINPLPIAFTYDKYIKKSDFNSIDIENRCKAMLDSLVINDEDEHKVSDVLLYDDELNYTNFDLINCKNKHLEDKLLKYKYDKNIYNFEINSSGEKYLYFAIPKTKYWKCTVNDKETELLNINGMMACRISAGNNRITLFYDYYVLKYCILLSTLGILFLILYILSFHKKTFKKMLR